MKKRLIILFISLIIMNMTVYADMSKVQNQDHVSKQNGLGVPSRAKACINEWSCYDSSSHSDFEIGYSNGCF